MFWSIHLFGVVALVQVFHIAASTDTIDYVALMSLKGMWENVPPNWVGNDPCGSRWDGIDCADRRVTSIMLASFNISGELSSDVIGLTELQNLDLSYNKGMTGSLPSSIGELKKLRSLMVVGFGFSGQIPASIGSLRSLAFLALNLNNFIGQIPPSIGNLSNLYWLDLADNKLTGNLPVSDGTAPGLDMLLNATHFHFGNNKLSGEIPSQLFSSNMKLLHLLLDHNDLTGSIPSSLGVVKKLQVVQLNRNSLSGYVPGNLNNLTSLQKLYLANNKFTGPLPNLSGMASLNYVDLSNNSFVASDVPEWFSSLQSLISLIMESTHIQGQLPVSLFSLPQLQTVVTKNNRINGTLDMGSRYSTQLKLIDLQNNFIDAFATRAGYNNIQIILVGNLYCKEGLTAEKSSYCTIARKSNSSNSTPQEKCRPSDKIYSPTCKCLYPYSGTLVFRATSFYDFGNESLYKSLEDMLMDTFTKMHQPVDSVFVGDPMRDINKYLVLNLLVFPSGEDGFNRTGISWIGFILSHQLFFPPPEFGPLYFSGSIYLHFEGSDKGSSSTAVIIGAVVGGSVLFLILIVVGVYAFRQKRIAKSASRRADPFASWRRSSDSAGAPQLRGVRCFSFEEIKKCTNNFSEKNDIGTGGYGKVHRGSLGNGQVVAIKRGHQRSMQGGLEFKTEIEILSRVHHKNVVGLVGFCFDRREHILVYEYIPNGTLKDSLNGKTGIRLDWKRRLRIALGAASGVQYLHQLANPPIIHRDIKSNNILLDERLNAKVADFGLCKLIGAPDTIHVTTEVKGTKGYLDPEYCVTQQLTEKSDVYSFGVLLIELLTSRSPITKGSKYIVREVEEAVDKSKNLYNLGPILDPIVASNISPGSVERFVDLAQRCVEDVGACRPCMSEVVKEIENIMEMAGLNTHADTSPTPQAATKGSANPCSNDESFFTDTGSLYPTKIGSRLF